MNTDSFQRNERMDTAVNLFTVSETNVSITKEPYGLYREPNNKCNTFQEGSIDNYKPASSRNKCDKWLT